METSNKISLVTVLFIAILVILILIFVITYFSSGPDRNSIFSRSTDQLGNKSQLYLGGTVPDQAANLSKKKVLLYFENDEGDNLLVEEREIFKQNDIVSEIRETLIEFFWGSRKGYKSPIPADTRLREVYVDIYQTVYIDLTQEIIANHSRGVFDEILTVLSLIKTVRHNFPQIARVQILVEGQEIETIAGHIMVYKPLTGDEFQQIF